MKKATYFIIMALSVSLVLYAGHSEKRSQRVVLTSKDVNDLNRPNRFPAQFVIETEYDESTGILDVYNTSGEDGTITLNYNGIVVGYSPVSECLFLLPYSQGVYCIIFETDGSEFRGWLEL